MVVQLLVGVRAHVGAGERLFEVLEERRVDRHDVLEVAVLRAILHHQDLAVALDDLRLDLADLLGEQDRVVALAVEDLLARLAHAGRAQRVGLARPAERRLHLLPRLQQRLLRPLRGERRVRLDAVQRARTPSRRPWRPRQTLFDVLDRLVHNPPNVGPLGTPDVPGRICRARDSRPEPAYRIVVNGQYCGPNWQPEGVNGQAEIRPEAPYFNDLPAERRARRAASGRPERRRYAEQTTSQARDPLQRLADVCLLAPDEVDGRRRRPPGRPAGAGAAIFRAAASSVGGGRRQAQQDRRTRTCPTKMNGRLRRPRDRASHVTTIAQLVERRHRRGSAGSA